VTRLKCGAFGRGDWIREGEGVGGRVVLLEVVEEEFGGALVYVVLSGRLVLLEKEGGGSVCVVGVVFLVVRLGEVELDGLQVLDGCLEGGEIIGG